MKEEVKRSLTKDMQVGGQAVIEGVMMRSPGYISVAVRKNNGEILVKREPYLSFLKKYKFLNIPIVRGVVILIETLYIGMKTLTFSADVAMQEEDEEVESSSEKGKKREFFTTLWLILTAFLGVVLALFLFFYLPLVLTGFLRIHQGFLFTLASGLIRITIFLIYLWVITLWKSMRRIFEYHGAEHKSIFTLEAGESLTLENVRKYSTHHPRCGTNFLLIVMMVSIAVFIFFPRPYTLADRLFRLLFVPLIAGISYELIKICGKKRNSKLVRVLAAPGLWLQRLTTKEPNDEQLKVAIAALESSLKGN
ncbi:DUF1385 domain-containing protein [Patescibacteria group bacterium]|nr:DUF1385 domain-containing protein [Patescibacteria group bacterium]